MPTPVPITAAAVLAAIESPAAAVATPSPRDPKIPPIPPIIASPGLRSSNPDGSMRLSGLLSAYS